MNLKCLGYKALDRFRKSRLGAKMFYSGVMITSKPNVIVCGTVIRAVEPETDGDLCFDVTLEDGQYRHCEVTPCANDETKKRAQVLKVGMKVQLTGDERFDPKHLGTAGWWEIHPVNSIEVL